MKENSLGTYADIVTSALADAEIEYIFGVPGSLGSVELIEAAKKRGIRYILCSNESSAAVMAGTYGILRNRPGVCSTGVGPGAAAAVLGTAHCWLERAPCLVLTDRFADSVFQRALRQRIDQDRLYRPISKGTFKLAADSAPETMRRALLLAMEGRQGPVHIDLPYDLMQAEAPLNAFQKIDPPKRFLGRIGTDHPGLAAAKKEISKAARPAVIAGLQINRSGKEAEIAFVKFAERLGAPVFESMAAKGVLPENHSLAAGIFRGVPAERKLLEKADLLIVVGFDPVELFPPGDWDHPQPVVLIDEVPHLEDVIHPKVEVVADLADSLCALTSSLSPENAWEPGEIASYKSLREGKLNPNGKGLMPGAAIRVIREQLPGNGILTADAGRHKVLASDIWESRRARGFLTSSGLGSMAVALPAALAANLLESENPVVCLTGDGGFLMRMGDLEVAAREGLAVVIVIFNDGYLNEIKIKQDSRSFQRLGTKLGEIDFVAASRAFGLEAARVNSEKGLEETLETALKSGLPWVIDAQINPEGYV